MTALYELLADCEWPKKDDRTQQKPNGNRPDIKPRNSIVRYNNSYKPKAIKPKSIEVEHEEYMTFRDQNSRMPHASAPISDQEAGVQMADISPPAYSRIPNSQDR